MANVQTVDITGLTGSSTFPVNNNEFLGLVEKLAVQNIRRVKSSNKIEDGFYLYDITDGTVIEEALLAMAKKQPFVQTGAPNLSAKDPQLKVKYFNNYVSGQYQTSLRRDEIRKIIASGKGSSVEEVVSEILATLTEGEGYDDYCAMRDVLADSSVGFDVSATGGIFAGKVPASIKGVIYCMREMYNTLKATNKYGVDATDGLEQATPVEDIRISITESLLNVMDVVELANIFNLSKEELMGKLVIIPKEEEANYPAGRIVVYDRKAMGRATQLYEYSQDTIGKGLYVNEYLTVNRAYFYNGLYKCLTLDASVAYNSAVASLLTDAS